MWILGRRDARGALLATVLGVSVALGINQMLGLLWFEPRPFMIGLGHTLALHVVENSFPSDHATFLWSLGFALLATGEARWWGVMVCMVGLLVAWARVYLGLHFPIDMAASFFVAIAADLVLLLLGDLMLAFAPGIVWLGIGVVLWGLHMGFTQGLLATLVGPWSTPGRILATDLAVVIQVCVERATGPNKPFVACRKLQQVLQIA